MKKYYSPVGMAFLLVTSFLFSACSKLRDYIIQHPDDIGKHCKIETLAFTSTGMATAHARFIYNGSGEPQELLPDFMYGPDLHFRYDKKGRLSDVLQTDPGGTFVYLWSIYTYPSARVIIDSIYEYQGNVNDPHPPGQPDLTVRIVKMQLDDFGRPVKFLAYTSDPRDPPNSFDENYDRNGNLVIAGAVYDNKINIYQTSKTWQLYFLDYSRNNRMSPPGLPATPAAYNTNGLPTRFLGPSWSIFGFAFNTMDVTYACDVSMGGISY